jgi:predicted Zn-dependent peptidase
MFGTRYGSIDTRFKQGGDADFTDVPPGIAHFLEHKLFESEEGDVFSLFAETGASANAFTAFDRTCYLFSCAGRFEDNLKILVNFVQSPYFTAQTVSKEQGIIGQEIRMYDDSAPWRVFFNLLTALYHNHPVRIDIAGTVESIAEITPELLYRCYKTFYNLNNMFICIAGNMDPDRTAALIESGLKPAEKIDIARGEFSEPKQAVKQKVLQSLEVSIPLFAYGFKEECTGQRTLFERISADMLLQVISSNFSRLYRELFDEGLINDSFSAEYFCGHSYAVNIFQGQSANPETVAARIDAELQRLKNEGIDSESFDRILKMQYGRSIMKYNSVENTADALVQCAFTGCGLFDELEVYAKISKSDLEARLATHYNKESSALSVVNKK